MVCSQSTKASRQSVTSGANQNNNKTLNCTLFGINHTISICRFGYLYNKNPFLASYRSFLVCWIGPRYDYPWDHHGATRTLTALHSISIVFIVVARVVGEASLELHRFVVGEERVDTDCSDGTPPTLFNFWIYRLTNSVHPSIW